MLLFILVITCGGLMSYKSVELEQAYDKLEDQYWELIEWLKEHAPASLQAFKNRSKTDEDYFKVDNAYSVSMTSTTDEGF